MKLLSYTSYRYFLFAALLTLLSIPISYALLSKIFVDSIDRNLKLQGDLIPLDIKAIKSERDLQLWKMLDHDLNIVPADSMPFSPKPFTLKKRHKSKTVSEDFRILQKEVFILGKKYYVNIESSLIEKEDLIKTILLIQLGVFFFLLSGAAYINYFINKKVWRPFYESLSFLKQFKIEPRVPDKQKTLAIEEFEQLNQSIHQLSVRVQKSYYLHKEFLENVSHELQTPLTVLKFKLELLLQNQMLTEEQGLLITDMYREIEHMQELNTNFLLLSKIENGQFLTSEVISLAGVVSEVVEELSFLFEAKKQIVTTELETEMLLKGNRVLLKILIKNLLINAIRYSSSQATIKLQLSGSSFEISNPGEPLDIPGDQLFERFIKNNGKSARSSNGLGLSIVKNIAGYHQGSLKYEYVSGFHHFIFSW